MRAEQLIGQVLGHYRIIRLLGYGGTASVFLAEDINLHREVAVKVFQPREGETQGFLRRFAREARVLAQLDHPNILPVYDYGEQGGIAYLIVPLMAGGSLKDRLKKQKVVPPAETVHLIGQILNALQYAHARGLVHRDIKPGNMLFKADGTLLLADFGLVKVLVPEDMPTQAPLQESVSLTGKAITGTPEYMSPEQISGTVGPASDIYSTGVVLYEMLSGESLFTAENYVGVLMMHLYTAPRPLRQLNPDVPPALEDVVMRCLAKDPTRRYQRPADLLQALQAALASTQPAEDPFRTQPAPAASPYPPTIPPPTPSLSPTPRTTEPPREPTILQARAPQSNPGISPTPSAPTERAGQQINAGEMQGHYRQPAALAVIPTTNPPVAPARKRSATPLIAILVALVVLLSGGLATFALSPRLFHTHPQPGQTPTPQEQTTPQTGVTPPTTTSCPAAGTARAAIMPSTTLGTRQNIIYIVDEGTFNNPIAGTIKRRDVTTYPQGYSSGVEISKMPGTYVTEAQVSQDGQWVMFTAVVAGQYQLRMVRVDGQDLQTLYCASAGASIAHTQWSFNQQLAVFDANTITTAPTLYLLDMTTGSIAPEVLPDTNLGYIARTWLDNSRVYLVGVAPNSDAPPQNIYLLDIHNGANQHSSNLQTIATTSLHCTDFDTSYDVKQLFMSLCSQSGVGPTTGPSTITVQPATGGTAQNIYSSATQAISTVRGVSSTMLFFMVKNDSGDTGQNGLWRINPDGTGATQLTQDPHNFQALCPFTQYAWSNLSRDGNMYALQSYDPSTQTFAMSYGSINGGAPVQFADISNVGLFLAGWTTL